ncbi:MAG: hypothetical protein EBU90_04240 [Proteobacteria bacterium]|nr:hypothetical protein [Pseudomonadota bacterium]NBP13895.1 hypothetical protein [bacterium]
MNGPDQLPDQSQNTTSSPKSPAPKSTSQKSTTPKSATQKSTAENNPLNSFFADIIWLCHLCVVAFVVLAPLTQLPALHILHVTFSLSLLVHWYCNSNVCSLSMIESKLRGLDYTESFTHRIVAPIYDISKTTWSKLCYTVTIVLLCISLYKLTHSPRWKQSWEAYNQKYQEFNNDQGKESITWYTKVIAYMRCFEPLFMLC